MKKIATLAVSALLCMCGLFGCSATSTSDNGGAGADGVVRIGTMPTEDILPMWVAEQEGFFEGTGIEAEVITFDSAQGLSAAITAGEVDMAMTDAMRAIKLTESGAPVVMEWITLGAAPSEGRFGILAPMDAPYDDLPGLAAYLATDDGAASGVGVAANTVPEYVLDKLCEEAGIDPASVPTQEVASLPERYSLVASGNLAGAALPASLLRLGESSGLKLIADDTHGTNISQSVMVARESFADEYPEAVEAVAQAWDTAVSAIASDPQAYLPLLAEKANLNETIAIDYPVSSYPFALSEGSLSYPAEELVAPQIDWMRAKGYTKADVSYDGATGRITVS